MDKVSQKDLDRIIKLHKLFTRGVGGGIRAILKFKDLSDLSFRGADLSHADFSGSCLNNTNLSNGSFCGTSFFSCDMNKANMERANFSRCDFRGAYIVGANLKGANFNSADLRQGVLMNYNDDSAANWGQSGKTEFAGSTVRDTDLTNVLAQGTDFSDANLTGVIIRDANLNGANFTGANLSHADFSGANMVGTEMKSAIVDGIKLAAVDGDISTLNSLIETEQSRKNLLKDNITIQTLVEQHRLWIDTAGKEGKQLNLTGYDLSQEYELRRHPLTIIVAQDCKFVGLNLDMAKMESSILDDSDFQDCSARKADFRGSSFKNAVFTRADFRGSNFGRLKVEVPGQEDILKSVNLSDAKMSFAQLDDVNFRGANLKNVNFSGASLKNADLTDSNLTDAIFDNADLSGTILKGTILEKPLS